MGKKLRQVYQIADFAKAIQKIDKELGHRDAAAKHKHDPLLRQEVRTKRQLLAALQEEYRSISDPEKTLFLSFPERLMNEAMAIKQIALGKLGFARVYTGFDEDIKASKTLRTGIIYKIRDASCFLGIWADDIQVKIKGRGGSFSGPGVWMPIELGMALALDKPVRLLLMKGIHMKFVEPINDFPHGWFADSTQMVNEAATIISALSDLVEPALE